MRHAVLVAAAAVAVTAAAAGCARDYVITQRSADALRALAPADVEHAAVSARAGDLPVSVRASRLELVPGPAATGSVRARARWQPRHPLLASWGACALGLGVILVAAGTAVILSPTSSSCRGEEFCGFGQGMIGVTVMGIGGALGAVGIPLVAVGASNASPELRTGEPGVVYLPR